MSHTRFELGFSRHRKVFRLSDAAYRLWSSAIDYCREQRTDGKVEPSDLIAIPRGTAGTWKRSVADELVASGLWHETEQGWQIHDFLVWQDSAIEANRKREAARERMRSVRANNSRTKSEVTPTDHDLSLDPDPSDSASDAREDGESGVFKAESEASDRLKADSLWVFDAWRKLTGHEKSKADRKRLNRIASRIREGFSREQLVEVIKNRVNDPWLMGTTERSTRVYDDIETLFRDTAQVERLIALTSPLKNGKNGSVQSGAAATFDPMTNQSGSA